MDERGDTLYEAFKSQEKQHMGCGKREQLNIKYLVVIFFYCLYTVVHISIIHVLVHSLLKV